MKTVVLLYETCCIYEIVITNYFLQYCGHELVFATIDGKPVTAQEKFSLNATCALKDIDPKEVELLLVPGGDISSIANEEVYSFIRAVAANMQLVAGICNGVDELDNAGILEGIDSTHSLKDDLVVGEHVITARANMYVDMAIAIGKKMNLFVDEADLQETIDFWKFYKGF
ncbi:Putative intracellular protease/amidase [Pseudobutyrivibrio sp. ACV-2]|uniref:DJ-1/PfpI family protein n=1 Tax=Pseudobutyrivibrio sp. ACV-2 TaxID=1520801 RepID=UPI00089525A6|nr:DJ-1/PfpI family protein [Pseudobutyrivibrio sp. ACV-2]SEA88462.1 Putative intracellular protease/amidase [Pseudobutyrivibrio sp. ACV-2]